MPSNFNSSLSLRQISFWGTLALLLVFLGGYFSTLSFLSLHWRGIESSTYSYGFLVLACVVYLLVLKKDQFRKLTPEPFLWAILPLLGFVIIWFVARVADVQKVQLIVIPLIILSATSLSLGLNYLRLAAIPISILYFSFPLWDMLWPYLQDITTYVTHINLQLIGRPVFVQGNILQLPGGSFFIDTSCGGLRFLLVSTILSLMYSDMYDLSAKQRMLLLLIGLFLSFLANWIRVLIVILVGDATNMESSLVEDHANLGWVVFFVCVLVPLFFITNKFLSPSVESIPKQEEAEKSLTAAHSRKVNTAFAITLISLILGPALVSFMTRESNTMQLELALPNGESSWSKNYILPIYSDVRWEPQYVGASGSTYAEYENETDVVEIHIVHYQRQQQNAELINTYNELAGADGWSIEDDSLLTVSVDIGQNRPLLLESIVLGSTRSELKKVWYWYNVGGQNTANSYVAKIYQVLALLRGRTDASLIAVAIDCDSDCDSADAIYDDFASEMMPDILAVFE